MALCTLAEVKTFMGIATGETSQDAALNQLITFVSAALALPAGRIYQGRPCLEKITLTQTFNVYEARTKRLWVAAWPIVSVTEIKEALYGAFTDADALVVNEGYQLDSRLGALIRIGFWLKGDQTVRSSFTGGYTRADAWVSGADYTTGDIVSYAEAIYECSSDVTGGTTPPPSDTDHWDVQAGEVPLPENIAGRAVQQIAYEFKRRDKLGVTSIGVQGGSFNTYARDDLLPDVRKTMAGYIRRMG